MSQLGFFDSGERVVLDDETGSIRYFPGALGAREAAQLFERLFYRSFRGAASGA